MSNCLNSIICCSEGYGFAVEGCEPFLLGPGEQRDLRIAFRPDFSSSLVKRDLLISTSQGTHSYPLVATLPYDLLPLCVDSQPQGSKYNLFSPSRLLTFYHLQAI